MEFGVVLGLDGLVGSSSDHNHTVGELPMKQRSLFGGFIKHGRPAAAAAGQEQQVDWRSLKLARTASSSTTATTEQMLSFSTSASKPEQYASLYHLNSTDGYHSHYYPCASSSPPSASAAHSSFRSAVLGSGSTNVSSNIHGAFTPSQWMELEHQALIYKYIDANIPVPSTLLVPFRRTTTNNPSPLSRSTTLGWGPFHLGFSGNADPEPGRCRRSDGKKWRCSRDVVADQKYCERHVNRGRHRSRKHVEGQSGQASKPAPVVVAPRRPASAVTSQQTKSFMLPNEPSPPGTDRIQMSKEDAKYHDRDSNGLSLLLDDSSPKPLDSLFPMSEHRNPFEGTPSRPDFGLIPTESLGLNPLRTSYSDDGDVGFHNSASKLDDGQPQQHHPLLHFIDDELPSLAWPRTDEATKSSDGTQLSISMPANISSTSSPPDQEKQPAALSPLRLSRGVDSATGGNQRWAGWVPVSWEPTIGGPLGEVLNRTNSSSSLNLLTDGWDASPRVLQSSPTGVLQKAAAFGSLSGSTGSSPGAENRDRAT